VVPTTRIGGLPGARTGAGRLPVCTGQTRHTDSEVAKIAPKVGDAFSKRGRRRGMSALGTPSSRSRQLMTLNTSNELFVNRPLASRSR
jgi:hypothetical protein